MKKQDKGWLTSNIRAFVSCFNWSSIRIISGLSIDTDMFISPATASSGFGCTGVAAVKIVSLNINFSGHELKL